MKWQYFLLILLIIPFVSSVNLDTGTVLNKSVHKIPSYPQSQ